MEGWLMRFAHVHTRGMTPQEKRMERKPRKFGVSWKAADCRTQPSGQSGPRIWEKGSRHEHKGRDEPLVQSIVRIFQSPGRGSEPTPSTTSAPGSGKQRSSARVGALEPAFERPAMDGNAP